MLCRYHNFTAALEILTIFCGVFVILTDRCDKFLEIPVKSISRWKNARRLVKTSTMYASVFIVRLSISCGMQHRYGNARGDSGGEAISPKGQDPFGHIFSVSEISIFQWFPIIIFRDFGFSFQRKINTSEPGLQYGKYSNHKLWKTNLRTSFYQNISSLLPVLSDMVTCTKDIA